MSDKRPAKGNSLILFPSSYVVIDIETTGLYPDWNEIIEISAIKIENSIPAQTFTSLVKPLADVSPFIEALTGISNDMLVNAPNPDEVISGFSEFVADSILIGHNVSFDINFIYDYYLKYLNKPLINDYVDTMRLFKKLYPLNEHHRLADLAYQYGIKSDRAHRALDDCNTALQGYEALHKDVMSKFQTVDDFVQLFKPHASVRSADIIATTNEFNEDSPLYKKTFVFTGALEKMPRKEAMQIVVNHGGINGDSITKNTNYLVLGNTDYCSNIKDGKSNKLKKAEKLKLDGYDIEIIPENLFYEMIEDTNNVTENDCPSAAVSSCANFQDNIQELLKNIIADLGLPENGLILQKNKGKQKITVSICINEPPFPATKEGLQKIGTTQSILKFEEKKNSVVLTISKNVFDDVSCPEDIRYKEAANFMNIYFPLNHCELYSYIKSVIIYRVKNYTSSASLFGCCDKFIECSDAKKCVHENKLYSTACMYRMNLDSGRIFYGKNRNID